MAYVICFLIGLFFGAIACLDLSWLSKDAERIDARTLRHVFVNEYPDGSLGHVAWSFKNEASDYTIDGVKPARQIQFVEVIQ